MNRRLVGVGARPRRRCSLACFARLAADPSALIVDADRPSVDHARPVDDTSAGNDLTRLFLPHHLAIARSIARLGHLPLWDDRGFGGRPLVGNPQAGLFYPPTWLAWWIGAPSSLGWITVGHLLWSGLGTYRLARTLGMGGWGSLVAAGCFQVSPYVLAQAFEGHYPHVWAACWYPWAFDAAIRLRRGEPSEPRLALAADPGGDVPRRAPAGGVLPADRPGRPGRLRWPRRRSGRAEVARRSGSGRPGPGSLVLTVGLVGVELVPDAMAQEWGLRRPGSRSGWRADITSIRSTPPAPRPPSPGRAGRLFGHENYWETVASIGLVPLVLAIIGVAWSPDRRAARGG